ncbi:MAG: type II secretion system protein [Verrucomicrobiales bacterium]|nr:type II secretion system protein [Verrucomicrobiales bacterium]
MRIQRRPATARHPRAFTLIELLVVMAIVAILASLLGPALGRAKRQARKANEINSARQLMTAWQLYADDHNDRLLPGFRRGFQAKDDRGNELVAEVAARYPWRLAPFLGNNFDVIYANENRAFLDQFRRLEDPTLGVYAASVYPSLGINSIFVGGDDELPPTDLAVSRFGDFCALQSTQIERPSDLMVFVSARAPLEFLPTPARPEGRIVNGFHIVKPPYLVGRNWAAHWDPADGPVAWGFVHPRYTGRAVAAHADGHVDSPGLRDLQDMRRWANPANSPDWVLPGR